jgi:hypothetical protein
MTEKLNFEDVIDEVLDEGNLRWFDLEFPAPDDLEDSKSNWLKAAHNARNWCGRVMVSTGEKFFAKIMITDARPDGSSVFHVFMANCDWDEFEAGKFLGRWEALTAGSASQIPFDPERLPGLLKHFVTGLDCPIEVVTSTFATNPTFRREDFE